MPRPTGGLGWIQGQVAMQTHALPGTQRCPGLAVPPPQPLLCHLVPLPLSLVPHGLGRCELLLWLLRNSLPLLLCPTHLPTEGVSGASFWRAGEVARSLVLDNDAAQYLTQLGKALPAPKPLQPARDPVFVSNSRETRGDSDGDGKEASEGQSLERGQGQEAGRRRGGRSAGVVRGPLALAGPSPSSAPGLCPA